MRRTGPQKSLSMPKVSKEHMEGRKRQILTAANRCFARLGLHNATMQDVIRESGLSAGAIYNHFSSKEDIIVAIADSRHRAEAEVCRNIEDMADAHAAVAYMGQAFFWHLRDPDQDEERRVGVQLWAEALNNERLLKVSLEGLAEPLRVLIALIDALKKAGEIPAEIETEGLARVMIALFQGFVLQKSREPDLDVNGYTRAALFLWERMRSAGGAGTKSAQKRVSGKRITARRS
jgi:AcrR family transcriptional regulator